MPRSLPPIPSHAPALTASAAALSLGPLELAHRLARQSASTASPEAQTPLLVVDVRARRQFARGHLPLSHGIPGGLLVSGEWPEGDLLLVDGGDGEALRVREALHIAGYPRRILQLAGGFGAWQAAGLPVEPSRTAWSWNRWLGGNGTAAPALPDLQELFGQRDLHDLLSADELLPELARLRRA